jgi:tetratricopeptide (TPR) repeat protein
MIVKNEAHVIRRCLASVRPVIDAWVIADTGSSDGTQAIVQEFMRDMPGELLERPWVDFAHNRNEALEEARALADYVLVIDADEVLEVAPGFTWPADGADSYNVEVLYGDTIYARKQVVRSALRWCYVGVLHEYLTCPQARTEAALAGLRTIVTHDGARARDPNTYRRDALLLERALIDAPEDPRTVFYLAQSWRDAGEHELALRYYRRCAGMNGWREEAWHALYQVGQVQSCMGASWPETLTSYLTAWQHTPDRAEPLYRIGMHHQAAREFHLAHLYLGQAAQIARPGADRLFVEHTLYDVHIPLKYAVACYYVGRHAEALAANDRLLAGSALSPELAEQVRRNRQFSVDAMAAQA